MLFQTPVFLIIANNTHNLHLWHINNQSFVVLLWVYYHYFHFNSCFSISVPLRRGGYILPRLTPYLVAGNRLLELLLSRQETAICRTVSRISWCISSFSASCGMVVLHHLERCSLYGRIWLIIYHFLFAGKRLVWWCWVYSNNSLQLASYQI